MLILRTHKQHAIAEERRFKRCEKRRTARRALAPVVVFRNKTLTAPQAGAAAQLQLSLA